MPKIPENQCPQNAESSDFVKDILKKLTYDCRFKELLIPRPDPGGPGASTGLEGANWVATTSPGDPKTTQAAPQEAPQTTLDDAMSVTPRNNNRGIRESVLWKPRRSAGDVQK